jgi:hypothetical protein
MMKGREGMGKLPSSFVGILVGLLAVALLTYNRLNEPSKHRPDFDHMHAAARFVLQGRDPYRLIGPTNREYYNAWPLYYPLPAVLAITPLAPLPVDIAREVFVFIVAGLLGYAVAASQGTLWRFAILGSLPFIESVHIAQWSPFFFAMWTLPWLSALAVVKPNHALAVLAGKALPRSIGIAIAGGAILTIISLVLQPGWVSEWIDAVHSAHHITPPIARPGGVLLLLAAAKWRRPEARLLFFVALIPSTPGYYETLVLFLAATTRLEIMLLLVLGYIMANFFVSLPYPSWNALFADYARKTMWFFYLPTLAMVLRRPNEGDVPLWLERRLARFPAWLRGFSPAPNIRETSEARN